MPAIKRAPTLKPSQLRHVLAVTQATSRHPERDCLAILLTHATGIRCTEAARLEIRDVLWPTGRLRDEVQLRAETTKNCRARLIFLTSPKLRVALETYLSYRLSHRLGCALGDAEYRGLMPCTKLLLTHRGSSFELVRKRRTLPDGRKVDYWAADALEARFRDLYRAAGIKTSSHAGRRSFASALLKSGVTLEQVAILLGHQDTEVTSAYIHVEKNSFALCTKQRYD
ncbi:tyrosine-type recombinase/integrase [Crenobacter cavernae]|uniref:Site-specific integrase n=1 Tax=Crenobacter cavernae TaxID=2290923 RepID=A0A345Y3N0_9NEIS|nr:site-specific integrase [Crenobacter cavernae]AXK38532.1 site-specific integrase [Crenobacter cavernae]